MKTVDKVFHPGTRLTWTVRNQVVQMTPRLFPPGGKLYLGILDGIVPGDSFDDLHLPTGYSLVPAESTGMLWERDQPLWSTGACVGIQSNAERKICSLFEVSYISAVVMLSFRLLPQEHGGDGVILFH